MHSQSYMVAGRATPIMPLGNQLTMSSREIAELTRKLHAHVIRDINNMISELLKDDPNLDDEIKQQIVFEYDSRNYISNIYLTKRYIECLLTGYSIPLRMKVIDRLHELENNQFKVPQTLPDALRLAAELAEQKQQLESKIQHDAPKVDFVDKYVITDGSLGFRQVCKILNAKESEFRLFLIENGIMYYLGGVLTPKQNHIDAKRFEVKVGTNSFNDHSYSQTKFTPKGVQWIAGLWASHCLNACGS